MRSRFTILFMAAFILSSMNVYSQGVSINDDGAIPDGSAMLDIKSNSKGILVPRLDFIEMFTIESPATGLMVYNTTFNKFYYYDGTGWERITGGTDNSWTTADANIYANNTGNVGIGIEDPSHKLTLQNEYGTDLLRLIGPGSYGYLGKINFGDGDYAYISEYVDDYLKIYGNSGLLLASPFGGVKISNSTSASDPTAILDVSSSSKGMLIPRLTTEAIGSISGPADGLQAYNTDNGKIYIYVELAGIWKELSYGSAIIAPPFQECGDLFTDDRDGQTYTTVEINGQCWMAENLNYGTMVSIGTYQNNNGTIEKYCYNNSSTYCDQLGGLYQWHELMDYSTTEGSQGVCPDGWYIPTDAEWTAMETFLDPTVPNYNPNNWRGQVAGNKLKKAGYGPPYNWYSGNNGTNESGFTGLPGGLRTYSGGQGSVGTNGLFWTSTESGSNAYHRQLYYGYSSVYRNATYKTNGLSVRCVKDE